MTRYWESPLVPVLNLLVRLHQDLILLLDCPAKSAQKDATLGLHSGSSWMFPLFEAKFIQGLFSQDEIC